MTVGSSSVCLLLAGMIARPLATCMIPSNHLNTSGTQRLEGRRHTGEQAPPQTVVNLVTCMDVQFPAVAYSQ